jgi:hypothetical protein
MPARVGFCPQTAICPTGKKIRKPADQGSWTARTTFHDLRHVFASTALAGGVPIPEVRSITTTADLYGHLVPEASGRARDAWTTRSGPPSMRPDETARRAAPQVGGLGSGRVGL